MQLPSARVEPTPRWVRVRAGGVWVADSRRALLLAWYGPGMLPTYCFPTADVRTDLIRPSPAREAGAGTSASAGTSPLAVDHDRAPMAIDHDVLVGDQVLERVARLFADPSPPLAAVDGHWSFAWDGRVSWFEEALEIHVHAKDPSKRVDAVPSERHVEVRVGGQVIAVSRTPHALFETTLPTRWYLPVDDVEWEFLEPSDTLTRCPYKGTARHWSVRVGGGLHRDAAWSYPEPVVECPRIAGLVAFYNEKVDLVIDGVAQPRPVTPWS